MDLGKRFGVKMFHHLLKFNPKHSCESRKTPKQKIELTVLEILQFCVVF
jgi:hypothetical protein